MRKYKNKIHMFFMNVHKEGSFMMKKFGLFPRLILAIIFGIIMGFIGKYTGFVVPVRLLTTFSGIFGNFLNFIIPFIIIGFIVPSIAKLGKSSGKLLSITV